MKIIRISFTDSEYAELEEKAKPKGLIVQDYIRELAFGKYSTIYTPEEAEKRAKKKMKSGDIFALPDLYTQEEWIKLSRGEAGVFGKRFFNFIEQKSNTIVFNGMKNRRASYKFIGEQTISISEDNEA